MTGSACVVGGGMLGMTLSLRLARRGVRVTLVEAGERLGGLAGSMELDGIGWDRFYHVILASDRATLDLLAELGIAGEVDWAETRTGVLAGGRLHSVSNALEFLLFPGLGPIDKARLAATILYGAFLEDGLPLEAVRVEDWLVRWSGETTFRRFWLPLLRGKLGDGWRQTSAAFIHATIRRLFAARRAGLARERFGTVHGGYRRVVDRLEETLAAAGVRILKGRPADRVEAFMGGVEVAVGGTSIGVFDRTVVTVASPLAARLCRGLSRDEQRRHAGLPYLGVVCAAVASRQPLGGFYVTNLLDDAPFTGVIEMTAVVQGRFGGDTLVYLPKYCPSDDPFLDAPDDAVRAAFLPALERLYPGFRQADVRAFGVGRARHVMALPTLGYSAALPPARTSVPGVRIVNSARVVNGTTNVNELILLADRTVAEMAVEG